MRFYLLCLLTFLSTARAHVIDQVSGQLKIEGTKFDIRLIIDAGYCLPEFRGDSGITAPDSAWINGLSEEEHSRLRSEAEKYLREALILMQDGTKLDYAITFTDYENKPYQFYDSMFGAPTLRLALEGEFLPTGGEFQASWKDPFEASLLIVFHKKNEEGWLRSVSVQMEPQTTKNLGIHIDSFEKVAPSQESETTTQNQQDPKITITSKQTGLLGFIRIGFNHVIPDGFDHILFIVGLFLFRPKWRPLFHQSLAFTVAHSATLAMSLLGVMTFSGKWVESLIALSIVYVAVENLRMKEEEKMKWRRLILVFAFGLLHGLGFGAMMRSLMPAENPIIPILGFNIGVEFGQILVLAICFLLFGWLSKNFKWVRIIGSSAIGITGFFWFIQRALL